MEDSTLPPDPFDQLLDWLSPDLEQAAQEYENIRRRLIKYFICRGWPEPEDATDLTINRVSKKVAEIKDTYVGPRAPYFYAVAHLILKELSRPRPVAPPPPPPSEEDQDEREQRHKCLDECMSVLSKESREIVMQYYQFDKRAK